MTLSDIRRWPRLLWSALAVCVLLHLHIAEAIPGISVLRISAEVVVYLSLAQMFLFQPLYFMALDIRRGEDQQ